MYALIIISRNQAHPCLTVLKIQIYTHTTVASYCDPYKHIFTNGQFLWHFSFTRNVMYRRTAVFTGILKTVDFTLPVFWIFWLLLNILLNVCVYFQKMEFVFCLSFGFVWSFWWLNIISVWLKSCETGLPV